MARRVLVTGASRGIGRAVAEAMAGPDVCLWLNRYALRSSVNASGAAAGPPGAPPRRAR